MVSVISDKSILYDTLTQFSKTTNEEAYTKIIRESIYEVKEDIHFFKKQFECQPQLLSKVIK